VDTAAVSDTERPPLRSTTAAVILAAGGGTRFEGDSHKLLAPFKGRPVISWVIDAALEAGFDEVYVIAGAVDLTGVVPDEVVLVENHSWEDGQATSLRTAVAVAEADGHDAIVVGLGDMPLVPAEAWRLVADAEGDLVTATFSGKRSPPVKIGEELWSLLPLSGDEGARSVIRLRPDLVEEVACPGQAVDIDTRGDLSRWS
jgi:molybdenum cofactor cytidylyltransferase